MNRNKGLHIALISVHGLIRGRHLELGRDADTGGQTLYVVELARALGRRPEVARVELFTRRVVDDRVDADYAEPVEQIDECVWIRRVDAGPEEYLPKEQLWEHQELFADRMVDHFHRHGMPDLVHSHYGDAGHVGSLVCSRLGLPLMHTGHSLGRVKRRRLMASGLNAEQVEARYNIARRIEAEEQTLATAEWVITSTHQEIEEQYSLYDLYAPERMRVIPPGTDLQAFSPPSPNTLEARQQIARRIEHFFKHPERPLILALSRPDPRKNMVALVEAYGQSNWLREHANLLIVAGNRDDIDELDEGAQGVFHELLVAMDRHDLYGRMALPHHHARDEVPDFYRLAAASGGVFVNPALTEPFGLTLIEAAACGLPLVATEDGGPRDIIGNCNNGLLVDPLESVSIAEAIERLLRDADYHRDCVKRGLDGVRRHYSWDAHAASYMELLRDLPELRPTPRTRSSRRNGLFQDRALFTDLDQNLLGDQDALQALLDRLRDYRTTVKVGIATGRRLDSALRLMRRRGIPEPDLLITSAGTEIYHAPSLFADYWWARHIDYHWTPSQVRAVLADLPGVELQPRSEQSRFKISYFIDPSRAPGHDEILRLLHQNDQSVNVTIAFGQYLDITPIRASKGLALRYVADRWQIPLERVFVAGGSGADEDMMRGSTLAAVVANRHHEELSGLRRLDSLYFARQPFAAGILEALEHYDFFGACHPPSDQADTGEAPSDRDAAAGLVDEADS